MREYEITKLRNRKTGETKIVAFIGRPDNIGGPITANGGHGMKSGLRIFRNALEIGMQVAGVLAIMVGAFVAEGAFNRFGLTVLGIIVMLLTNYDMHVGFLPSERKFVGLRAEVDRFIDAVRTLNRAATTASDGAAGMSAFHTASEDLIERARSISDTVAEAHSLVVHR
jgi:hypothetical protein